MSVNKCPWCGGKFGLVRHYHFRTGFCREQCRRKYQASWERKKLLRRLIFRPPSVWLETGNASTPLTCRLLPRQVNCPFSNEGASVICCADRMLWDLCVPKTQIRT
jgi:hypothetical protein